jgi:tetratricopeptide (TPR) repeat protein
MLIKQMLCTGGLCLLLLCTHWGVAQQQIDSLYGILQEHKKTDTLKVQILNALAFAYRYTLPDSARYFAKQALLLSQHLNYPTAEIEAYQNLGLAYDAKGNYQEALRYYKEALRIAKNTEITSPYSITYNYIANVYNKQGYYPQALQYYQKAIVWATKVNDQEIIARCTNNMAIIYANQGKYETALQQYQKALGIRKTLGLEADVARSLQGIAIVYHKQGRFREALAYHQEALNIRKQLQDSQGVAFSAVSIAQYYAEHSQPDSAQWYLRLAIEVRQAIADRYSQAWVLEGIADTYLKLQCPAVAAQYARQSLQIATLAQYRELIRDNYHLLSQAFEQEKQYDQALDYHKRYKAYHDSIHNQQVERQMTDLKAQYQLQKQRTQLEATQVLYETKMRAQRRIGLLIGTALLLLFSVMVWGACNYYRLRKAYAQLAKINEEAKQAAQALAESNQTLVQQAEEIQLLNETLEQKVKLRTQHLAKANETLRDYAFLNSHTLRRPLANILAASREALRADSQTIIELQGMIQIIRNNAEEVDQVIYEINDRLEAFEATQEDSDNE